MYTARNEPDLQVGFMARRHGNADLQVGAAARRAAAMPR